MRKGEMSALLFLLGLMPITTSQGMIIEHPKMLNYDHQDESQPPPHIRPHLESAFDYSSKSGTFAPDYISKTLL